MDQQIQYCTAVDGVRIAYSVIGKGTPVVRTGEAENLFLRHQLSIALRRAPPRIRYTAGDRALLVWVTRMWPSRLGAAKVVQPETILRCQRAGFKAFWRGRNRGTCERQCDAWPLYPSSPREADSTRT